MNRNTWATLHAVDKVTLITVKKDDFLNIQQCAALTHFAMTQYSFKKPPRLYPGQVETAVGKDIEQLQIRDVFAPQDATKLMTRQKKMALKSIMIVKEKHDKSSKGQFCADDRKQQVTMEKDEPVSPTIGLDSVFITTTFKSAEGREVAIVDLPCAYLSADMVDKEEALMVLQGPLADLMARTSPEVYYKFITINTLGRKLLYVKLQKALYPT